MGDGAALTWNDFERVLREKRPHYRVIEAGGAPDCFFHCIAWWERRQNPARLRSVPQLRRLVYDEFRRNPPVLEGQIDDANKFRPKDRRITSENEYFEAVLEDLYAGEPEICAITNVLGVELKVFQFNNEGTLISNVYRKQEGQPAGDAKRYILGYHANHFKVIASSPPVKLCLSGGGIRAAAVASGVLRRLATRVDVEQVSSVSGGGYAAAAYLSHRLANQTQEQAAESTYHKIRANSKYLESPFRVVPLICCGLMVNFIVMLSILAPLGPAIASLSHTAINSNLVASCNWNTTTTSTTPSMEQPFSTNSSVVVTRPCNGTVTFKYLFTEDPILSLVSKSFSGLVFAGVGVAILILLLVPCCIHTRCGCWWDVYSSRSIPRSTASGSAQSGSGGAASEPAKSDSEGSAAESAKSGARGSASESAKSGARGSASESAKSGARGSAAESAKSDSERSASKSSTASTSGSAATVDSNSSVSESMEATDEKLALLQNVVDGGTNYTFPKKDSGKDNESETKNVSTPAACTFAPLQGPQPWKSSWPHAIILVLIGVLLFWPAYLVIVFSTNVTLLLIAHETPFTVVWGLVGGSIVALVANTTLLVALFTAAKNLFGAVPLLTAVGCVAVVVIGGVSFLAAMSVRVSVAVGKACFCATGFYQSPSAQWLVDHASGFDNGMKVVSTVLFVVFTCPPVYRFMTTLLHEYYRLSLKESFFSRGTDPYLWECNTVAGLEPSLFGATIVNSNQACVSVTLSKDALFRGLRLSHAMAISGAAVSATLPSDILSFKLAFHLLRVIMTWNSITLSRWCVGPQFPAWLELVFWVLAACGRICVAALPVIWFDGFTGVLFVVVAMLILLTALVIPPFCSIPHMSAVHPFLQNILLMLGAYTNDIDYLCDGGFFENLGVFAVMAGNPSLKNGDTILCFDSSEDFVRKMPSLSQLVNYLEADWDVKLVDPFRVASIVPAPSALPDQQQVWLSRQRIVKLQCTRRNATAQFQVTILYVKVRAVLQSNH